jgi:integrase
MTLAATDWELRASNPCTGIKRFGERKRERYLNDAELAKIGEALAAAERDGTATAGFCLLIRLLATTGMRLGEALGVRWGDIDLPGRTLLLRDAKAGSRTVHLGAAAVAILDAARPEGAEDADHVVHGHDPQTPLSAPMAQHAWDRLRERAGIPDARMHDLRHTAGTFAALAGANAFAVRDLLGHRTLAMTGRYVERAADMVRATADAVSSRVAAALAGKAPAEIVTLQRRRR